MNYQQQLRDPRWLAKRQEIIERAKGTCEYCENCPPERLEVHHGYYVKGRMAWEYPNETLYCLCFTCHRTVQEDMSELYESIAMRGLELDRIRAMINKNFETREQHATNPEVKAAVERICNSWIND